jgi:hypothetical protein
VRLEDRQPPVRERGGREAGEARAEALASASADVDREHAVADTREHDLAPVRDVERERSCALAADLRRERQVVDAGVRQSRVARGPREEQRLQVLRRGVVCRAVAAREQAIPPHVLLRAERGDDAARVARARALLRTVSAAARRRRDREQRELRHRARMPRSVTNR